MRFDGFVRARLHVPAAVVLSLASSLAPARAAVLVVEVLSPEGEPATDARVTVIETGDSSFVDETGTVRFEDVPGGMVHVEARSRRFGGAAAEVEVVGAEERVLLRLQRSRHTESIVVSASAGPRGIEETYTPVDVLDDQQIRERVQPTLGETLAAEPGVTSTYYGPGSSRPVIRGQGAGRIRILEGGLGVGDASATSPDHALSTDALTADRVEILRGPATLLYGSSAVGGAINVLDHRVPTHAPDGPLSGQVSARYGSAAGEAAAVVEMDGGGSSFAWHVDALRRDTEDYDIPGRAVEGDPASPAGKLPNSSLEAEGATLGGSWVSERGFVGVSARGYDTDYGIPAELEEGFVRIDLEQRRYDLRGERRLSRGPFDRIRFAGGVTDYAHRELAGGETGTRFFADTWEGRVDLAHRRAGPFRGIVGIQAGRRALEALGEEAFVPPSDTDSMALFVLEEAATGPVRWELGLRWETTDVAPERAEGLSERSFDGLSGSVGLVWEAAAGWSVGASAARTTRFPSAEELLSDGPHLATFSYERGDPDLREENGLGFDLGLRRTAGRITGDLSVFVNRYDDYIFEAVVLDASGAPVIVDEDGLPVAPGEDGLPLFAFTQADAEFRGAEAGIVAALHHSESLDLDLELTFDTVRAELRATGEPLPRIPPRRAGAVLLFRGARWYGSGEIRWTGEQDRTAPGETATDGHTFVNATLGYRFTSGRVLHDFMVRGRNLTDREARNHVSRLKSLVPLPGRDVGVVYRLVF